LSGRAELELNFEIPYEEEELLLVVDPGLRDPELEDKPRTLFR
jgi:hypothetical protein